MHAGVQQIESKLLPTYRHASSIQYEFLMRHTTQYTIHAAHTRMHACIYTYLLHHTRSRMHTCSNYHMMLVRSFWPRVQDFTGGQGALAVLYDKNPMEVSGYAAAMADISGNMKLYVYVCCMET